MQLAGDGGAPGVQRLHCDGSRATRRALDTPALGRKSSASTGLQCELRGAAHGSAGIRARLSWSTRRVSIYSIIKTRGFIRARDQRPDPAGAKHPRRTWSGQGASHRPRSCLGLSCQRSTELRRGRHHRPGYVLAGGLSASTFESTQQQQSPLASRWGAKAFSVVVSCRGARRDTLWVCLGATSQY